MNGLQGITISNDNARLVATNFWRSELAQLGKFLLSTNAGTIRLLTPLSQEMAIAEMKTAQTVVLTRGPYNGVDNVELLFDDGTDTPYGLWIDARQADRLWPASDDGRQVPFVVYTLGCRVAWSTHCWLRRSQMLPDMTPWKG